MISRCREGGHKHSCPKSCDVQASSIENNNDDNLESWSCDRKRLDGMESASRAGWHLACRTGRLLLFPLVVRGVQCHFLINGLSSCCTHYPLTTVAFNGAFLGRYLRTYCVPRTCTRASNRPTSTGFPSRSGPLQFRVGTNSRPVLWDEGFIPTFFRGLDGCGPELAVPVDPPVCRFIATPNADLTLADEATYQLGIAMPV